MLIGHLLDFVPLRISWKTRYSAICVENLEWLKRLSRSNASVNCKGYFLRVSKLSSILCHHARVICKNEEFNLLVTCRENSRRYLGLHCTNRQTDSVWDFSSSHCSKSEGMLYAFRVFRTAELVEKNRRSAQTHSCSAALDCRERRCTRLKHCNLSTIPKKGTQNQAP